MSTVYRFKWQLILICIGLIVESIASMASSGYFDYTVYNIGVCIKIAGLLGLIWKLGGIENK